jgi:UDP-glucose 4-epimerase
LDRSWYAGRLVLVTGGAGFIGSHLVDALVRSGAEVRVLDNLTAGTLANLEANQEGIDFRLGDIRDRETVVETVKGVEIVFHLAANASVPGSVADPENDFQCNALGTLVLLQALRDRAIVNCVVASSGAVYGQPGRFPIAETHPLLPISPYGGSKMAVEGLCRAFHTSFGIPVQIARIFNTYGPRQPRFVMFDFYRKLRADPDRLEILGDGRQVRDYCFVEDTVDALLRLGSRVNVPVAAFNISSGRSHTVIDVAESLCEVMGLEDVRFTFTGSSWAGDAQRWEVSIDKLVDATGYVPQHTLRSGLERFAEWFDSHPERLTSE